MDAWRVSGVTASKVLFDTWARWEILQGIPEGARLQHRYLDASGVEILTSVISLGGLSAKLASQGPEDSIPLTITSIRQSTKIMDLTSDLAAEVGILRSRLRKREFG